MGKATMELSLYWDGKQWVFDDPEFGLEAEPFVMGASEIITRMVREKGFIAEARKNGVVTTFSDRPFDCDHVLHWVPGVRAMGLLKLLTPWRIPMGGNWYCVDFGQQRMYGWLCPQLFNYFEKAPSQIYVKVEKVI